MHHGRAGNRAQRRPRWPSLLFPARYSGVGVACILDHCEGDRHLAFQLIVHANHGDFGNIGMRLNGLFDLARAEAMAGNIDDIVGAAKNEIVAVLVAMSPVERGVNQLVSKVEK